MYTYLFLSLLRGFVHVQYMKTYIDITYEKFLLHRKYDNIDEKLMKKVILGWPSQEIFHICTFVSDKGHLV